MLGPPPSPRAPIQHHMPSDVLAMTQTLSYRYALRLKPTQERKLYVWTTQLRWVWNEALKEQKARHARGEKYANYFEMSKWLTGWRTADSTNWLADGPVQCQQQVLRRLHQAYANFFKGIFREPRRKSRGQEPSLRYPEPKLTQLDQATSRIRIPKLGWVRLRLSREPAGAIRNVTLLKDGNRWFVSVQCEVAAAAPTNEAPSLGIDLGVTNFAATSAGTLVPPLRALQKAEARLRHYQRVLNRKKKRSRNRAKARSRYASAHRAVAQRRRDWLHKLTTDIAAQHCTVVAEELSPQKIVSGWRERTRSTRSKFHMNASLVRAIHDAGWVMFREMLAYKLRAKGGGLVLIPPAYTSRRCAECGHEGSENRPRHDAFSCSRCGHKDHADLNAARNILAAGRAVWTERSLACGEDVRRSAVSPQRSLGEAGTAVVPGVSEPRPTAARQGRQVVA